MKDEDFNWLSQQFVDELTNKFLSIDYLLIKDFSQVLNALNIVEPSKSNVIDLGVAQKLGEEINSNYILYGNYLVFNKKQIRITSNLADVKNGAVLASFQETYDIMELMDVLDAFPTAFKKQIENLKLNVEENSEK